jgi:two-component system, chemotaxis family, sensor kinase CheA
MAFDTQDYIELFYQDSDEHLQLMTDALLDLEKNPQDREALGALFRSAHTMKSSSAMVGFMHISEFTHKMEDLIGFLRDTDARIDTATVDILFQSFDILKDMLNQLQDEASEAHRNKTRAKATEMKLVFGKMLGEVDSVAEEDEGKAVAPRIRMDEELRSRVEEFRLAGEFIYEINIRFLKTVQMASTRAFLILNNINQIGSALKTDPNLDDDNSELDLEFALLVASAEGLDRVKRCCDVSEVESVGIREVSATEQFEWPDGSPPSEKECPAPKLESTAPDLTDSDQTEAADEAAPVVTSFERREDRMKVQTVRVSIDKLDRLLNLTAEMVIQRGRAYELSQRLVGSHGKGSAEEELLDVIVQQGMFLTQLQETIMESRMVPIGTVFQRFRRVVRDLAHTRGKKVNLVIEGEDTELDKKIIDQIGDPLMHMVRNSVDHGIEEPHIRKENGKTDEGLLHLNATHVGNNIVISIKDDGKGLDPEQLKLKAIEKGNLTAEEANTLSRKECLNLIFRAGFSMAKQVTDISGRGVGMDVVRRSIEALGGAVEIDTEQGKGTTFHLKLPLTLAIIQALLVESHGEMYALPIAHVSETIRIKKSDIFSVKGKGKVIRLRDEVVPIINLRQTLGIADYDDDLTRFYVAIMRNGEKYAGLIVDRMVNEQEIVIKSLSGDVSKAAYVSGASILGDGRVILILDTVSLIEEILGSN